ncbi:FAD-dependent oxidoreductase [Nocardia sp. NPDC004151]|uniref:FAD-dependent oxidoreductase n=1 Tax=Nocardia sp. NPDC004151 TaxID=3364304 RepID=UPI0036D09A6B
MVDAGMSWDVETDVVVVGFGGAGCAAAISAHDAGARVLVLDKESGARAGGSTRVSGAVWFDNQDPERAAVYLRSLSAGRPIPEPVIEVWARETARNSAWMESLGIPIGLAVAPPAEFPDLEGSDVMRGWIGVEGRMGDGLLWAALSDAVRARDIEVRLGAAARELVTDDGTVLGVLAETADGSPLRIRARRGVVLATGGFEADPDLVRDHLRLTDPVVWGTPAATGDGLRMAVKAGADLWHMSNMMTLPGLRAPGYEAGFYTAFPATNAFVYLGFDGRRLCNERVALGHGHARINGSYQLFPTTPMHIVFDESARRAGPIVPGRERLAVGWASLIEGYEWSSDNSAEIGKGWIHRADTVEELAELIHVDPEVLRATLDRYNAACAAGSDDQFGRPAKTLAPISEPPYYAFTSAPILAWSNGGPRRNEHAEVLDPFGATIPGLYAAGNVSSTYSWCKDGGFHIADALAFGRVAGSRAAARTTDGQ